MFRFIFFASLAAFFFTAQAEGLAGYKLKQVLMLSRHSIRTPLATTGSALAQITSQKWPDWDAAASQLTTHGGVAEIRLARFIRGWLGREGLLSIDKCPGPGELLIYANSISRTLATAQFFAAGAFAGCEVSITHAQPLGKMDPLFNPIITNSKSEFRSQAEAAMSAAAKSTSLAPAYALAEGIIDFKNSPLCKRSGEKNCHLGEGENIFTAQSGKEPGVSGPLALGNSLADALILEYYEGFTGEGLGWGRLKKAQDRALIASLKNAYQEVLFTTPIVAKNVAKPLLDYLAQGLFGGIVKGVKAASATKLAVLFGHDSNIASVMAALDILPQDLPGTDEHTPIAGILAFEKWEDEGGRNFVRIEYIYPSAAQLRAATVLDEAHPPQRVALRLKNCPPDKNALCPVGEFEEILRAARE